jgi:hypothetical protein
MTTFEWATVTISFTSLLLIPALILLVRITVKVTRNEDKLNDAVQDLHTLTMNSDRRIRWLEENIWKGGNDAIRNPPRRR